MENINKLINYNNMENTNKLIDYEEEFLNNPDEMLEPYNPDEMLEPYDIEREKRITE